MNTTTVRFVHTTSELDRVLNALAPTTPTQSEVLRSVVFALSYYAEPDLYFEPVLPDTPILDGGVRARAALKLMRNSIRQARCHAARKEHCHE